MICTLYRYSLLLCLVLGSPIYVLASENVDKYWYEVTIRHGDLPFEFYGSSNLNNIHFMSSITDGSFIRLENLMFRQEKDKKVVYIDWQEWDPIKENHMYLNVRYIIAVHPLKGNPREVTKR